MRTLIASLLLLYGAFTAPLFAVSTPDAIEYCTKSFVREVIRQSHNFRADMYRPASNQAVALLRLAEDNRKYGCLRQFDAQEIPILAGACVSEALRTEQGTKDLLTFLGRYSAADEQRHIIQVFYDLRRLGKVTDSSASFVPDAAAAARLGQAAGMNAATLFDNSQNVSGGVSAPAPSGLYVAPVWSAYTGSTGGQTSAFGTATTGPLNVSAPSGIMTPATPEQIAAASAARTDFDTDVLPDPAAAYYAAAPWTLDAVSPSDSSLSDESGSDEYLAVATTEQAHALIERRDETAIRSEKTSKNLTAFRAAFQALQIGFQRLAGMTSELITKKLTATSKQKQEWDSRLGITDNLVGAGIFNFKLLDAREIHKDLVKAAVYKAGKFDDKLRAQTHFVRISARVQLINSLGLPVDIISAATPVTAKAWINGYAEVTETRLTEGRQFKAATRGLTKMAWPLSSKFIRRMKIGEDVSLVARIDRGLEAGIYATQAIPFNAATMGLKAGSTNWKSNENWLHVFIEKIDPSHVTILVETGKGSSIGTRVSIFSGLDFIDDLFKSKKETAYTDKQSKASFWDTLLGMGINKGRVETISNLENMSKVELGVEFARTFTDVRTRGWSAVDITDSLTEKAVKEALAKLGRTDGLEQLKAGSAGLSFESRLTDVTKRRSAFLRCFGKIAENERKLSLRQLDYVDEQGNHRQLEIAEYDYHGINKPLNASRERELTVWYDKARNKYSMTMALGPQKRTWSTTRARVEDVAVFQKELGLPVANPKISDGRLGRTTETANVTISPAGFKNIASAPFDTVMREYLAADWSFERNRTDYSSAVPPWAARDGANYAAAKKFFTDNYSLLSYIYQDHPDMEKLTAEYEAIAPGRDMITDWSSYADALKFTQRVLEMQRAYKTGDRPEDVLEAVLELKKDFSKDPKKMMLAMARLSSYSDPSVENYTAYAAMSGKHVSLTPDIPQDPPLAPDEVLANRIEQWKSGGAITDYEYRYLPEFIKANPQLFNMTSSDDMTQRQLRETALQNNADTGRKKAKKK